MPNDLILNLYLEVRYILDYMEPTTEVTLDADDEGIHHLTGHLMQESLSALIDEFEDTIIHQHNGVYRLCIGVGSR